MTKDVIVSISGLQMPAEGEAEPVEVITVGDYYQKNGKHYVLYEEVKSIVEVRVEVNEGFEGSTKNIIKMQENCIDITKKGVSNVHMVFEKNRKNMSYYGTPFGNLLVGIDAKDIKVEETEHCIDVQIDYALEVNYEHLADCTIKMKIASKEKGEFSLA